MLGFGRQLSKTDLRDVAMECRKSVEIAEVVLKHYTYYVHMVEYWWEYACGGIPDIRFRETHQKHIGFFSRTPP